MSAAMKNRTGRPGLNPFRTQSLKSQASPANLQTSEEVAFAQWVAVWQSVMKRTLAQMGRTGENDANEAPWVPTSSAKKI